MKHVILTNSSVLVRVAAEDIAFVESDGSYSTMTLVDGAKHVFSFNLSAFEKVLVEQLGDESRMFIRVGKSLIINREYIYLINLTQQTLSLRCHGAMAETTLSASREALKGLKSIIENEIGEGRKE